MKKNILELCKEMSNIIDCSVEEALNYMSTIIRNANYKKIEDSNIDFTYDDLNKENRVINSFVDYFIEIKGNINIKELSDDILKNLNTADADKLKEMVKVFHNIEDIKFKISLLKNFNDLSLFKKDSDIDYINHVKTKIIKPDQEPLYWKDSMRFYNYIAYWKFLGENKTYKHLIGSDTNHSDNQKEIVKKRRIEILNAYEFIFENIPYLLPEFKLSSILLNANVVPYVYKVNKIHRFELVAMCLEEGTLFELIKYKKKYYDSIKKNYPVAEGKTIYKANIYNQGDNKEEIDNFLEETFGLNKLTTLIKKDNINKEI